MIVNPAIRNMIRDNKIPQIDGLIYSSAGNDLVSMDSSLLSLYKNGRITADTALAYASNPEMLKRSCRRLLLQLLNFFNCCLIFFCYFFHCFRYPRLLSGPVSQKFCKLTAHFIQTVKGKILTYPFQCVCTTKSFFVIVIPKDCFNSG